MDLVLRVAQVITPVFLIIGVGYFYGRRHNPDLTVLNRVALDVLTPAIIYAGLASRGFQLAEHGKLLLGMLGMMLGCGLIGWPLARWLGVQPRTLVPVLMFNNSGNTNVILDVVGVIGRGASAFALVWLSVPRKGRSQHIRDQLQGRHVGPERFQRVDVRGFQLPDQFAVPPKQPRIARPNHERKRPLRMVVN